MSIARTVLRRGFAMGVSVLSVACGFMLVFRMGTSEILPSVPTGELLAFLGLMILPGLAIWAVAADRSARSGLVSSAEHAHTHSGEATDIHPAANQAAAGEMQGADVSDTEWSEHDAHGRPAPERHRRRADVVVRREVGPGVRRAG